MPSQHKKKGQEGWKPRASGSSGRRLTHFERALFVAIDGEGRDTDAPALTFEHISDGKTRMHTAHQHIYTLLSVGGCLNNDTRNLYSGCDRLTSYQCLDFLTSEAARRDRRSIYVSFAFSYDTTHILRDISSSQIKRALSDSQNVWGKYGPYFFKYHPRRILHIIKVRDENKPYIIGKDGKKHLDSVVSMQIWDVFGFFQCSFAKALEMWGIGTEAERQIIRDGKAGRSNFSTWSYDEIRAYNEKELDLLCEMMQNVRRSAKNVGLVLNRYDGAGAVAAAIFKKELPKDYIKNISIPPELDEAAHYAYFGGRIETIRYGYHQSTVYRYDINSAYPAIITQLPNLHGVQWHHFRGETRWFKPFALYKVSWRVPMTQKIGPFPYREPNGNVSYPHEGYNWIWGVEIMAALRCGAVVRSKLKVKEGWYYEDLPGHISISDDQSNYARPFNFVRSYYDQRAEIKRRARIGEDKPGDVGISLIYKLGMNSLYGKMAQKIGYNVETHERPPFYNALYAGFITAATRAALLERAFPAENNIISLATDGILSTEPLPIVDSNNLGEWSSDKYDAIVQVQSGVYWLRKGETWIEYSRGIDRALTDEERLERVTSVRKMWQDGESVVEYSLKRLIGLKAALVSKQWWYHRGNWVYQTKEVQLFGGGAKRIDAMKPGDILPYLGLVDTLPFSLIASVRAMSQKADTPEERYKEEELEVWE